MKLEWNRSTEYFVKSKCGRYAIVPDTLDIRTGARCSFRNRPKYYNVYSLHNDGVYYSNWLNKYYIHPRPGHFGFKTQSEAKDQAQREFEADLEWQNVCNVFHLHGDQAVGRYLKNKHGDMYDEINRRFYNAI